MAPRNSGEKEDVEPVRVSSSPLLLNNLKKAIPQEAFEKSIPKSIYYMACDYTMWFGLVAIMKGVKGTLLWDGLALWQQIAVSICFWAATGTFMWAIFMIGHDCGHGTFSEYESVNDFFGHLTHGSLLVPFYPWQLSHRRHHLYHNHADKDYSHPWYTEERLARPEEGLARAVNNNELILALFPIVGWHLYLYGFPDGSHYFPNKSHRLWRDGTPSSEFSKCIISTSVVAAYLCLWFFVFGGTAYDFLFYYFVPYCVFAWWIVTVTYLQHHSPGTLVYHDDTWNFVLAAFETVDRSYGFGLDTLLHNITDGHVVHHLFFKNIPHYHLAAATQALKKYLQENNLIHLYRHKDTPDFMFLIFQYITKYGLRGTEAPPAVNSTGATIDVDTKPINSTSDASFVSALSSKGDTGFEGTTPAATATTKSSTTKKRATRSSASK